MNTRDRKQEIVQREQSKAGRQGPINAKCAECIYDPIDAGTWKQQVEACTVTNCPLYRVRPIAYKSTEEETEEESNEDDNES